MKRVVLGGIGAVGVYALGGCANNDNIRYVCAVTYGYEKHSSEWNSCMQEQMAVLKERGDAQKRQMIQVVGAAAAVAAEGYSERAAQQSSYNNQGRTSATPGSKSLGLIICPDGSWVYGSRCVIAPNGKWVGVP